MLIACFGCTGPSQGADDPFATIFPNDTVVAADSGLLLRPIDLTINADGEVVVLDAEADALVRIDPTKRGSDAVVHTQPFAVAMSRPEVRPVSIPGSVGDVWRLADSLPQLLRYGSAGQLLSTTPLLASELTSIRVRRLYEIETGTVPPPVRYATDVRLVAGAPWVLLNMSVEEGAVVLVFDAEGVQRGKLFLPATEGGRRFAVDTLRARLYVTGPNPPQLLSVDLSNNRFLWERRD